jgi:hypothetical protein
VSTRVVSWKEAAEMKDRVWSEALVIPRRIGSPWAGRPPLATAFSLASSNSIFSTCSPLRSVGVARVEDLPLLEHLADDHLDVLVVDLHALEPVDVLHLVDEVVGQRLDPHDPQDVVRRGVAVHDVVALLDEVAFGHRDVLALGHHVLDGLQRLVDGFDRDPALVLVVAPELHVAVDLGDDRVVLGTARLEQFRHARQTAGDVLGLGPFARDPRHHVAGLHLRRPRPRGSRPPTSCR